MSFDIHQLDGLDYDAAEEVFAEYADALLESFVASPEAQAHLAEFPDGGSSWVSTFLDLDHGYLGVSLPEMTRRDVKEIVTDLMPRKISLLSPDDAADAIPELMAFWRYLKREHALDQADEILGLLEELAPDFISMMYDPSKFGMAKSVISMGQEAGFDMTNPAEIDAFMYLFNAASLGDALDLPPGVPKRPSGSSKAERAHRKKRRKMARASRKKSRRK